MSHALRSPSPSAAGPSGAAGIDSSDLAMVGMPDAGALNVSSPPSAEHDQIPGLGRIRLGLRVMAGLPRPPFELLARSSQKPTLPARSLVSRALVTRERVGPRVDDVQGVPLTWIDRPAAEQGTILHLHGGMYTFGEGPQHWQWLEEVRRRAGMAGAMVHYRMPPTGPFPGALDDALTVIRELLERGELRHGRWVLSGDSAGGGLALAVLQRLREDHRPMPAGVLLTSPWTDLTLTDPLIDQKLDSDRLLDPELLSRCAQEYAGEFPLTDPRLSPAFGDLSELPPVLLVVGTEEILLGDARRLSGSLRSAGVPVAYAEIPGGQHDHPVMAQGPAAQWALRRQIAFAREACGLRA